MDKEKEIGITVKKDKDFSEWYVQCVLKSGLADYSPVKGCMIIKPHGYALWENIQKYFNEILKKLKVRNCYFPLFVPESFFKKEVEHSKGFKPEVAWIHDEETGERLAIRPTSETVMYDAFSRWIRSYRDLPLRINQWCNVVRWETKATRLFLRTREFLWQEGHCAYATEKECEKETLNILMEYKKLCEELLAIPVLAGRKSEKEKFAGALYTLAIETLMSDGRALQMGTSHNLGQNFAKAFDITFLDENSKRVLPWQNSWGISTRLIGAVVMMHGDDKGLVIPPRLASIKGVVVPIGAEKDRDVVKEAERIKNILDGVILDDREFTPGYKFNDWELKGVPVRIEIGPKDVKNKQVVLARRDTGKKENVKLDNLKKRFNELLEEIQNNLLEKAKRFLQSNIKKAKSFDELENLTKEGKLALASFCGKIDCEDKIKDKLNGVKTICIPLEDKDIKGNCVHCGEKAKCNIYFAKSY